MKPGLLLRVIVLGALWMAIPARAGVLGKADIERLFPDAYRVLDKDRAVPVWPIVKLDGPRETVTAYVFESIDLAPLPGFAGEPFNLLIALDRAGQFQEVQVLSQREPVFLDGLGPEPLLRFVEQYRGKRIIEPLRVVPARLAAGGGREPGTIDGVSKATASVRIVNETVLTAALEVARAKLGFAARRPAASVRADYFEVSSWARLLEGGLIAYRELSETEVEAAFAGTNLREVDDLARRAEAFPAPTRFWVAYLNLPTVGRNLLGEAHWSALQSRLEPGEHALLVLATGPRQFVEEEFVRGGVPRRLVLKQDGLPISLRDLDFDLPSLPPGAPSVEAAKVFRVSAASGFDPAAHWQLALRIERRQSPLFGEVAAREFALGMKLPASHFMSGKASGGDSWVTVWLDRSGELAVLAGLLVILWASLLTAPRLFPRIEHWRLFRWGYWAVCLGFIGYFAQGQVSIVQIAGVVRAWAQGNGPGFLLHDPITLVLLGVAALGLLIWGRGSFCGWLCPYGALQEFVALAARRLRLPQWAVSADLDRRLAWTKYFLLAALLATAVWAPAWSDLLAQSEPFKTAITLGWRVSGWPLLYALVLVVMVAVVYKAYCRWLCPLGALLTVGDVLRRWPWIPRRPACGRPCQSCRKQCAYDAIADQGAIRYRDCFACMECVYLFHDSRRCAPLRASLRQSLKVLHQTGRGQ